MARYEIDGMIVDQIVYWYDQPVVYLGRVVDGDDRPCLVVLVSDGRPQVYHRLRFSSEEGLRRTLASGAAPTSATYALADDLARLASVRGDEPWIGMDYDSILRLDGPCTSLPPGRSTGDLPIEDWADDHWTLLLYLAERQEAAGAGNAARAEYHRMRINGQNHVVQSDTGWIGMTETWKEEFGTRRLATGERSAGNDPAGVAYHDDFDCMEEFEAEGLLDILSTARGEYRLTSRGETVARDLRSHVERTGSCDRFDPCPAEKSDDMDMGAISS